MNRFVIALLMKIGIVGSGNMGGALGLLWAKAGHEVIFSFSRDEAKLKSLAANAGQLASYASPEETVANSDVVMMAVAPSQIEVVLGQLSS